MNRLRMSASLCITIVFVSLVGGVALADWTISPRGGQAVIKHDGRQVAVYVYRDKKIRRPYFAHIVAPGGVQLTRNHPPAKDDPADHADMHPGLWMAFGDLSGNDFWRNRATVEHVRFVEPPRGTKDEARFVVENRYVGRDGKPVCRSRDEIRWRRHLSGYHLYWRTQFRAGDRGFYFGDQEEMGLGVRVATQMTEKRGGLIRNSDGKKTAKETWGQPARWCDYSATVDGRRVGVAIFADKANTRTTWWHNRDYGLMVANAFGRKAMRQGPVSRFEVKPGNKFSMTYRVLFYRTENDKLLPLEELSSESQK